MPGTLADQPFRGVPTEVLQNIFGYLAPEFPRKAPKDSICYPESSLLKASRETAEVALSVRDLWSLAIGNPLLTQPSHHQVALRQLERQLLRSGSPCSRHPVHVLLGNARVELGHLKYLGASHEDSINHPTHNTISQQSLDVLTALEPYIDKLHFATVIWASTDAHRAFFDVAFTCLRNARWLSLEHHGCLRDHHIALNASSLPLLEVLVFRNEVPFGIAGEFLHVVTLVLHLDFVSSSCPSRLQSILSECLPALRTLDVVTFDNPTCPQQDRPLNETIETVNARAHDLDRVANLCVFGALKTLRIKAIWFMRDVAELLGDAHGNGSRILARAVHLDTLAFEFVSLVQGMPKYIRTIIHVLRYRLAKCKLVVGQCRPNEPDVLVLFLWLTPKPGPWCTVLTTEWHFRGPEKFVIFVESLINSRRDLPAVEFVADAATLWNATGDERHDSELSGNELRRQLFSVFDLVHLRKGWDDAKAIPMSASQLGIEMTAPNTTPGIIVPTPSATLSMLHAASLPLPPPPISTRSGTRLIRSDLPWRNTLLSLSTPTSRPVTSRVERTTTTTNDEHANEIEPSASSSTTIAPDSSTSALSSFSPSSSSTVASENGPSRLSVEEPEEGEGARKRRRLDKAD